MSASQASRGDVWSVNLDPILGREQSGIRPALVLSVDKFNHGPADLVIVLPITSKNKRQPLYVEVTPPEGGIKTDELRKMRRHPVDIETTVEAALRDAFASDHGRSREPDENPIEFMNTTRASS